LRKYGLKPLYLGFLFKIFCGEGFKMEREFFKKKENWYYLKKVFDSPHGLTYNQVSPQEIDL
jgi:hypothetical protein